MSGRSKSTRCLRAVLIGAAAGVVSASVVAPAAKAQGAPEIVWRHQGHAPGYDVYAVAFSSGGDILASGSEDFDIRLWRSSDGTHIRKIDDHGWVMSVGFSPDGELLASATAGFDMAVRLWRVSDGSLVRTLTVPDVHAQAVAFSPDGAVVASGWSDGNVRLWRVSDGALLRTLTGHAGYVESVVFFADGQTLASCGAWPNGRTVKLWRVSDGSLIRTLEHGRQVHDVAISADENLLASAGSDGLKLWQVSDGTLVRTMPLTPTNAVSFSPDGRVLVSGGGTVRLWRVSDGALLRNYTDATKETYGVRFSIDGVTYAYATRGGWVTVARNPFVGTEECGWLAKIKAKCKDNGATVIGKLAKSLPNSPVTFTLDGKNPIERTTNGRGKAKVKYTEQAPGPHKVASCDLEAGC
ncbi:MAG: WD40 repeat domain-containing protein [Phycisphaerales bacterium]|nr:MAG: WD40 repeat domain-containing protein [Phycisphaerales bacterium]